jgi:hypothetical protein
MEDSHRAVMAVDTSTCLLVRSVVSVLFMFDSKPESMNRGEVRSFSQATIMYTIAAANNAQHSAGQPMRPVEDAIWPSTPDTVANERITCHCSEGAGGAMIAQLAPTMLRGTSVPSVRAHRQHLALAGSRPRYNPGGCAW